MKIVKAKFDRSIMTQKGWEDRHHAYADYDEAPLDVLKSIDHLLKEHRLQIVVTDDEAPMFSLEKLKR